MLYFFFYFPDNLHPVYISNFFYSFENCSIFISLLVLLIN